MEELKVRAKCLDEWIEGYFCVYRGIPQILVDELSWEPIDDIKTVGRYTGLCDKNGNKIFEGDIVEYEEENGEIVYHDKEAMFVVCFDTWLTDFDHLYGKDVEIVGNIHDNPELFK